MSFRLGAATDFADRLLAGQNQKLLEFKTGAVNGKYAFSTKFCRQRTTVAIENVG